MMDSDFGLSPHREAAAKLSRNHEAFGKLAEPRLGKSSGDQQDVVSKRHPTQPRPIPRKPQGNETECDEKVEELCEDKTHFRFSHGLPRTSYTD